MSDVVDTANDSMDYHTALAIQNVRANAKPAIVAIGKCHNCDEPLNPGETFCDADCAEDFEKWPR